jgi:hypothetical protein
MEKSKSAGTDPQAPGSRAMKVRPVKIADMGDNIDSYINAAKVITERLVKLEVAMKKRDACRYKLFEAILDLDKPLRKMGKPKQVQNALKARYGTRLTTSFDPAMFALVLVYPTLNPKKCSRYAAALRFVRRNKRPGESVEEFMKAHGGIKGCEEKDKKSRSTTHGPHKKK